MSFQHQLPNNLRYQDDKRLVGHTEHLGSGKFFMQSDMLSSSNMNSPAYNIGGSTLAGGAQTTSTQQAAAMIMRSDSNNHHNRNVPYLGDKA